MPDDPPPFPNDQIIIIRWDSDEGRPVYSLGTLDPWGAATLLQQVVEHILEGLPAPRADDEEPEDTTTT
jgi:hypothetical protein